jgi:hypothetical protein
MREKVSLCIGVIAQLKDSRAGKEKVEQLE